MSEIEGLDELNTTLAGLAEKFDQATVKEISAAALVPIFDLSQELVPVRTGALRESGDIEEDDEGAVIGYSADYAEAVEYGTVTREAQPYLRPAIDEMTDAALGIVTDEIVRRVEP